MSETEDSLLTPINSKVFARIIVQLALGCLVVLCIAHFFLYAVSENPVWFDVFLNKVHVFLITLVTNAIEISLTPLVYLYVLVTIGAITSKIFEHLSDKLITLSKIIEEKEENEIE